MPCMCNDEQKCCFLFLFQRLCFTIYYGCTHLHHAPATNNRSTINVLRRRGFTRDSLGLVCRQHIGRTDAGLSSELSERAVRIRDQRCRGIKLRHVAFVNHKDAIKVKDGIQSVRNRNHGAVLEVLADHALDERICVRINCSCCFVKCQDLSSTKARTGKEQGISSRGRSTGRRSRRAAAADRKTYLGGVASKQGPSHA